MREKSTELDERQVDISISENFRVKRYDSVYATESDKTPHFIQFKNVCFNFH